MTDVMMELQVLASGLEEKSHTDTCLEAISIMVSLHFALRNICEGILNDEPSKDFASFILSNEYFAEQPDA